MKLILSRKGLDSSFGSTPSPIMPDDSLCWLPIPEDPSPGRILPSYADCQSRCGNMGDIISELSGGKFRADRTVHLDPDLYEGHCYRKQGWRGLFGQTGAAQRHLKNHGVGPGDLFVFFGWFRKTEVRNGRLRFERGAPDWHVVYGWMQVDKTIRPDLFSEYEEWMYGHPHVQRESYGPLDAVYVARESLIVPGISQSIPGAGLYDKVTDDLILTEEGESRSKWLLPSCFYPDGKTPLSYHDDPRRWALGESGTKLRSAARGQEFVLDLDEYPDVVEWLKESLFNTVRHPELERKTGLNGKETV